MSARHVVTFAGVGEPTALGCVVRWQVLLADGTTCEATTTVNPRSGVCVDLQADYGGPRGFVGHTTGHPDVDAELIRRAEAIDAHHRYGEMRRSFLARRPPLRSVR